MIFFTIVEWVIIFYGNQCKNVQILGLDDKIKHIILQFV